MTPDEQTYFDAQVSALRGKVDANQYNVIWAKARTLTMDQAIELAVR
jgi:hypothetical protein